MLSVSTQISVEDDLSAFTRMLESVKFADEIIVFNMERTDVAAKDIFRQYGAKVVQVKTPRVVEEIRAKQVQSASGLWVLIIDYDEVIPPVLAKEIVTLCSDVDPEYSAYKILRRNFSLGFPLRHGGFGDDYVHRLFYKKDFIGWPSNIHSTPKVRGRVGELTHFMEHHKDASLSQMVTKTNRYSDIEAQQFYDGGLPPVTPFTLVRKSTMEFIRRYIFKKGFLDGSIGLIQAIYQSYSVFVTYAKLYKLQNDKHMSI